VEIFVYILIAIGAFAGAFVLTWLVFGVFIKAGENRQSREYVREYITDLSLNGMALSTITRQNIVDWARTMGDIDITIKERTDDPQMPHSLRWKNKTFALAYGTDAGVLLIVWITDEYAATISKSHRIDRAKFPKGPYWWAILIGQSWTNKEMVMELLKKSVEYVSKKK